MARNDYSVECERLTNLSIEGGTLIEGLPGLGLVAAIAVDRINDQLGLEHFGTIHSDEFPPVATFEDGLVHDLVRMHATADPPVMTLQSDLALPQSAYEPLSSCVLSECTEVCDRAIFIAGAPAESEEQLGEVVGIATKPALKEELLEQDIEVLSERGAVGGITGALVRSCYRAELPATLLIVRAHPFLPDPGAAKAVIETALEPLVDFDIETQPLEDQAEEIREQLSQVAAQYQQITEEQSSDEPRPMGMYQ